MRIMHRQWWKYRSGHTFIGMDGKSLLFSDNRASACEFRQ